MRPVIEMVRLCHFKRVQNVSRYSCCSRASVTVVLKFGDDFALTRKMPLAVNNVALGASEVIDKRRSVHSPMMIHLAGGREAGPRQKESPANDAGLSAAT